MNGKERGGTGTDPAHSPVEEADARVEAQWWIFIVAMFLTAIFILAVNLGCSGFHIPWLLPDFFLPLQFTIVIGAFVFLNWYQITNRINGFRNTEQDYQELSFQTSRLGMWLRRRRQFNSTLRNLFAIFVMFQLLVHAALVESTGGMKASPYAAIVLTIILLGPTIMVGRESILLLGAVSALFVMALYLMPNILDFSDPNANKPTEHQIVILHMVVTIATIVISMFTAYVFKRRADEAEETIADKPEEARVGEAEDASEA
jgi:hypothetical protein